ncbi:MAG: transglutaminase-like domain-containing protein [Candidatus Omnitrophica bacterium]|nr:transglutaminase-like domain-containing protein [Candidatus Omnitrophota bacterium]MBU4468311.1 transglutaminase-like domain-containing protein [Candidatus Omnitrophota bacterium]MCG2707278.1 transglutaminase-like domain-containing protein [Candidatus Omnitrophota bacterium]
MFKRKIYIVVFIIILIDAIIGYALFKSRSFSHLAIWDIIESSNQDDFYWLPDNAPGYFQFEPDKPGLDIFKNEIQLLIRNKKDDFGIMLEAAKYVVEIFPNTNQKGKALKWDSPEGMLRQIRAGASGAHCFHRAILFSAYLSGSGLKSRLWALENEKFNSTAHTVNEVYIKSLKKWVFVDIMFGFYAVDQGNPLSFLELREKLLNDRAGNILVQKIGDGAQERNDLPVFYPKLIKCVFLRVRNDFIDKYNTRYGFLSVFQSRVDKLPNGIRIGTSYLFGGQDRFTHYVDRFSKSLKPDIIISKALFYFLVSTMFFIGILGIVFILVFLRVLPAINLSIKDTRQR